jgi:hypothetical protein
MSGSASLRHHRWLAGLGAVGAVGLRAYVFILRPTSGDPPTWRVVRGQLQLVQVEAGEIQAASGEVVSAPSIGGQFSTWPN